MSDMLHQIKSGTWLHLIDMFEKLICHICNSRQEANHYLDEIDKRITLIPKYPGLKTFPNGIRNLKNITAGEYAQIMKVSESINL
jgi:plasmid rolling circle replication initiator protein Rep